MPYKSALALGLKFQLRKRYQIDIQKPIYEADATNTSEEIVADSFAEIPLGKRRYDQQQRCR
ncbi:hypothetical protein [Pseudomonas putida]|uniref:hypothetical protein n=1 Tax=Pseudomonas putida TaxID=303 RepID=UPI0013CE5E8D|nr:hypothetical protein [Pseudomonas putida]